MSESRPAALTGAESGRAGCEVLVSWAKLTAGRGVTMNALGDAQPLEEQAYEI